MLDGKEVHEVKHPDVIHEEGGKWYFWEETWADRQGPFDTRQQAVRACDEYCINVLGIDPVTGTEPNSGETPPSPV